MVLILLMIDYHEILGVSKNATKEDIRKAYKKLALKEHPDKGGDEEKFRRIAQAYDALTNEESQTQFQGPRFKLKQHVYHIMVSMEDLFKGKQVNLKVTLSTFCTHCRNVCPQCGGSGSLSPIPIFTIPCPMCSGQGVAHTGCSECVDGRKPVEKTIEITIDPGTEDGHQILFECLGEQARKPNEVSGDLIIVIQMKPHHLFTREGQLLVYTHQLNLCDMIIGTQFDVPLFDGPYTVCVPGIINPTKPHIEPSKKLKVQWVIEYPTKTLTDVEKQIILKILSPVE